MDQNRARQILGLKPSASFEDAKKAYRNLAKRYHPDVAGKLPEAVAFSESKMKEINLAFRLLRPHLKQGFPRKNPNQKKDNTGTEGSGPGKDRSSGKKTDLFSFLRDMLKKGRLKKTGRHTAGPGKSSRNRGGQEPDNVGFSEILSAVVDGQPAFRKAKKRTIPAGSGGKTGCRPCPRYQNYMMQRRYSGSISAGKTRRVAALMVSEIEPISPVSPVDPVVR